MPTEKSGWTSSQRAGIFLKPGDFYFGGANVRIRTLLGSCVALTMWHPRQRIGGMSHSLLPSRAWRHPGQVQDGRYLDEALSLFDVATRRHGTSLVEYHIKMFGGSEMFPGSAADSSMRVGQRNVDEARRLLERCGLRTVAEHVGGSGERSIIFELATGRTWFRHRLSNIVDRKLPP